MAEELQKAGVICTVTSAELFYNSPHFDYDVYVFHRPNAGRLNFTKIIGLLKQADKVVLADYDDLIFGDEDLALISSAVKNGTLTKAVAIRAFASNLRGLLQFDRVTVSTQPLAEWVSRYNASAKVVVVPNIVPGSIVDFHRRLNTPNRLRPGGQIGYFAGTKSHDLPVVQDVLHRILSENATSHLLIVGPVAIPKSLSTLPNVTRQDVVNYTRLPFLMTRCSTVIAPLQETAFNACKSRVKFIESALAGCRLIATPIPDMEALAEGCVTLARTKDEWYETLTHSLTTPLSEPQRHSRLDALAPQTSVTNFLAQVSRS